MNIYINGDNNVVNVTTSGQPHYWQPARGYRSQPKSTIDDTVEAFLFLVVVGIFLIVLITKSWLVLVLAFGTAGLVAVSYATHLELERKARAEDKKRRRQAALAARADQQNAAYLRGEPYGMYGEFPTQAPGGERLKGRVIHRDKLGRFTSRPGD